MRDGFVKVAVGTPRVRVADCVYNADQTIAMVKEAAEQGVKLLVLPELGLTGYTCGDLFFQKTLIDGAEEALGRVLEATRDLETVFLAGLPVRQDGKLYNCVAVCQGGEVLGLLPKLHNINPEQRYFSTPAAELGYAMVCGREVLVSPNLLFRCVELPEFVVGVEICRGLWIAEPQSGGLASAGATVICNPAASSEAVGKAAFRRQLVTNQSIRINAAYLYADAGDGESTSDVVYAGHDLIAENGELLAEQHFRTGLLVTEIDVHQIGRAHV